MIPTAAVHTGYACEPPRCTCILSHLLPPPYIVSPALYQSPTTPSQHTSATLTSYNLASRSIRTRPPPPARTAMSSYLPSFRRAPSAPVDDAPLNSLPACELTPLKRLEAALHADIFAPTCTLLHPRDPWRALAPPNRRALALRFLRFHLLQEAAALEHARRVAAWRAADRPWERPLKAMSGPAAGLPVLPLHPPGRNGDVLVYSPARAYVRAQVNHAAQEEAVKTFFESLFYAQGAQKSLSAVVVLDFHGMSMSNVDLVGTKNGIRIFADFYPDVFSKVLVVNYARWLHGSKLSYPCIEPIAF